MNRKEKEACGQGGVSETPRTEAACAQTQPHWGMHYVLTEFARELERELIACHQERDNDRTVNRKAKALMAKAPPRDECPGCFSHIYDDARLMGWCTDCAPPEVRMAHNCNVDIAVLRSILANAKEQHQLKAGLAQAIRILDSWMECANG